MQESGAGGGYYPQPVYPGPPFARKSNKDIWFALEFILLASGGGSRGYLRIVAPDMTEGDYVEIQCEGASSEEEGNIQWYYNNRVCIHFHLILIIRIRYLKKQKKFE